MIHTIDLHFQGIPTNIAAFLLETSAGPVLIETGPHSTLPILQAGITKCGYLAEDVRHVFLSHIHLDHAGAAWWFAQQGANIYVHPEGVRHLAAPERLMESARRIYQDKMDELWGQMHAISADQLLAPQHGEEIALDDKTKLQAWYTPGHAVHHIAWQWGDQLFTGDVAGVRIGDSGIVIPPCPPPDIHIADWKQSLALIRELAPRHLYLTHFGPHPYEPSHLDELSDRLDRWANWIRPYFEKGETVQEITPKFQKLVAQEMNERGLNQAGIAQYEAANPGWMSVAGLLRYWKKHGNL